MIRALSSYTVRLGLTRRDDKYNSSDSYVVAYSGLSVLTSFTQFANWLECNAIEGSNSYVVAYSGLSRIPVRLYVCNVHEDFDDLEDAPHIDSWDKISYINRPVDILGEGKCFTLLDAVKNSSTGVFHRKIIDK
ncbi:hypothetical protein Acr_00g0038840 [Actinidia rufa]|uniref:Uncharacterized protein n=1 Tax=Actinidia rufa TaxID=165716 RepID=A0A7J0DH98_9ERIC|nr:hypothetical protein Acr_00g0038840 [Actinidia rufa]